MLAQLGRFAPEQEDADRLVADCAANHAAFPTGSGKIPPALSLSLLRCADSRQTAMPPWLEPGDGEVGVRLGLLS